MLNSIFFNTSTSIDWKSFMLCTLVSLVLGGFVSLYYMYKTSYTKGFACTLTLLPAMVCVVIMLVNGNLGAGVATMGAFSLVRFRSVPGTAKDISCVFLTMAIGLACGMGYLGVAVLFTAMILLAGFLISSSGLFEVRKNERILKITIPEHLNYNDVFEDIFLKYTKSHELISVKTSAMGSLYKCEYQIFLNQIQLEKEMIDELRVRNGNLEISCCKIKAGKDEL